MSRVLIVIALAVIVLIAPVYATSSQSFVIVGDEAIEQAMEESPSLEAPILLESSSDVEGLSDAGIDAEAELEAELTNPLLVRENELIAHDSADLAHVEVLAHQLGAPVYSELAMEKSEHEVNAIEHSLISADSEAHHEMEHENGVELLSEESELTLPTALLESIPDAAAKHDNSLEAETEEMEKELNMVELSSQVERAKLDRKNDYNFLDDPVNGGAPTVLKNLKGLDIYVVNTPIQDNPNEIRPVAPPAPMSAALRERARRAALLRKQLIHDIPQPKAHIKPKTRIDTLSAYEPSLVDSRPLRKMSRLSSRAFDNPIVGGHGAIQLKSVQKRRRRGSSARFQQIGNHAELEARLPGTTNLPVFPKDPRAPKAVVSVVGVGSSFDNRDGPPRLLDDMLPLKAQLVEELDPLGLTAADKESKPNW